MIAIKSWRTARQRPSTNIPHCQLHLATAFLAAIITATAISCAHAENSQEKFYKIAEPKIKSMYEGAIKSGAWQKAYDAHVTEFKNENKGGKAPGNWLDHVSGSDWLKIYYYNLANVIVTCAEETGVTADDLEKEQGDTFKTKFRICLSRRMAQINVFLNIDNKVFAFSVDKFSSQCEPKARLVGREQQLPPYDFLKVNNPDNMKLIAFGVYLKCFADHGMPMNSNLVD